MMQAGTISMPSRGYYSLRKVDADGQPRPDGCVSNTVGNTITYEGAYYSLITDGMFGDLYAALGTGSTERDRDSAGLGNESQSRSGSAQASRQGNEVDNGDGTSTLTLTRELAFSLGSTPGTFSEVGLFTSSSSGTFVAGQLIKDEMGDPTTITVKSDEQLVVTYTLEWTVPNATVKAGEGQVTDSGGTSYDYTVWAAPYFQGYSLGSGDTRRYRTGYESNPVLLDGDGNSLNYIGRSSKDLSLGSMGKAKYKESTPVVAPSDLNQNGIAFVTIGVGRTNALSFGELSLSETEPPAFRDKEYSPNQAVLSVEFNPTINKTSKDSFSMAVELEIQV